MMKQLFQLAVVLWLAGFLWHAFGHFRGPSVGASSSPPAVVSPMPPPLESPLRKERREERDELLEVPMSKEKPAEKKHFWQKAKPRPEPVEDDGLEEAAPPVRRPPPGGRFGLPLPGEHFSGAKLFIWARTPDGQPTCPGGERLLQAMMHYGHGFTVGDGPQFDVWVIRVPPRSERCPLIKFYFEGKEIPPEMKGSVGPEHLKLIFSRIPRANGDVDRWPHEEESSAITRPRPAMTGAIWPGLGIRYQSKTDIGVGLGGFGAGASPYGG